MDQKKINEERKKAKDQRQRQAEETKQRLEPYERRPDVHLAMGIAKKKIKYDEYKTRASTSLNRPSTSRNENSYATSSTASNTSTVATSLPSTSRQSKEKERGKAQPPSISNPVTRKSLPSQSRTSNVSSKSKPINSRSSILRSNNLINIASSSSSRTESQRLVHPPERDVEQRIARPRRRETLSEEEQQSAELALQILNVPPRNSFVPVLEVNENTQESFDDFDMNDYYDELWGPVSEILAREQTSQEDTITRRAEDPMVISRNVLSAAENNTPPAALPIPVPKPSLVDWLEADRAQTRREREERERRGLPPSRYEHPEPLLPEALPTTSQVAATIVNNQPSATDSEITVIDPPQINVRDKNLPTIDVRTIKCDGADAMNKFKEFISSFNFPKLLDIYLTGARSKKRQAKLRFSELGGLSEVVEILRNSKFNGGELNASIDTSTIKRMEALATQVQSIRPRSQIAKLLNSGPNANKCPICLDLYSNKTKWSCMSSCGHSFCSQCLSQVYNTNAIVVKCPSCQTNTPRDLIVQQIYFA